MKDTERFIKRSLKFLDNAFIRWALIIFIILYTVVGVPNFPANVSAIFMHPVVQAVFLLLIVYIGVKDLGLAMTLALAFVVSLFMARRGDLFRGPRMAAATATAGATEAVGMAGDVLTAGEQVASTVLGSAGKVGADVEATARQLTGEIMDLGAEPEGYNTTVTCFRACDDIVPLQGSQCQNTNVWDASADVQGVSCPEQGWAALPPGAPL